MVFGSPPYIDARLYLEDGRNLGIARQCEAWVEWMVRVSAEAVRVSRGPVFWVVAGRTCKRNYQPGPEGLIWEWYKRGGMQECPCYWHRVGISGSGGDQWFRKDVEYVIAFKRDPKFPWSDNTACGEPPKWAPGGAMSHRLTDGTRRNQWGAGAKSSRSRRADGAFQEPGRPSHQMVTKVNMQRQPDGSLEKQSYVPPAIANPGNYLAIADEEWPSSVVHAPVGKGHMGHDLSHTNEAPFPERLCEHFIKSFVPPGGLVLDPFSGSGTTVATADRLGRRGIGLDLRASQGRIGQTRLTHPCVKVVPQFKQQQQRANESFPLFRNVP